MISRADSLAHTKWVCKYYIVFTSKYRRKIIYNQYKESVVQILKDLCKWKGVEIIEGKAMIGSYPPAGVDPAQDECVELHGVLEGKKCVDDV